MQLHDWDDYLNRFHAERPGITEDVLGRASGGVRRNDPYRWILEPLPSTGRILDLACGSAPLLARRAWSRWVGVDRSISELAMAGRVASGTTVCADCSRLPFSDGTFDSLVCSMAMMLFHPFRPALEEIRRVMAAGAVGCLLLPDRRPLSPSDVVRYTRLLVTLRQTRLVYPSDSLMVRLPDELFKQGLRVVADERRRFLYRFDSRESVERFVNSLYLPGASPDRITAAVRRGTGWIGSGLGIPLRRVVFERM